MIPIKNRVVKLETRRRSTHPERPPTIVFVRDLNDEPPPTARVVLPEKSETIAEWVAWVKWEGLAERGQEETQKSNRR